MVEVARLQGWDYDNKGVERKPGQAVHRSEGLTSKERAAQKNTDK